MIQASSVFPWLKDQGYSITVNCTERGFDIIKNDPHVDAIILQPKDWVPNEELGDFWDVLAENFDRYVNLSESVEGSLLAMEGRSQFRWDPDFRRLVNGRVDYLEAVHAIAKVPLPYRPKFYPTQKEIEFSRKVRRRVGGFAILWSLSGSSFHKAWPYTDNLVARLLHEHPDIKVIFVGDDFCRILEQGWEKEPRVICRSGKWSIRQTLAMAQVVDLVVGPETGVLNAVSFEDVGKVLMLSHSSRTNLGGGWKNTSVIEPIETDCFPCHKMHYSKRTCNEDEVTGAAMCAARITVDAVQAAIEGHYERYVSEPVSNVAA